MSFGPFRMSRCFERCALCVRTQCPTCRINNMEIPICIDEFTIFMRMDVHGLSTTHFGEHVGVRPSSGACPKPRSWSHYAVQSLC